MKIDLVTHGLILIGIIIAITVINKVIDTSNDYSGTTAQTNTAKFLIQHMDRQ